MAGGGFTGNTLNDLTPYFNKLIQPKRNFLAFFKLDKNKFESLTQKEKNRFNEFYPVANFIPEFIYSMIEKYDDDGSPIINSSSLLLNPFCQDLYY